MWYSDKYYTLYSAVSAKLQDTGNYRQLPDLIQDIRFDFSSNDYLNLSQHPKVIKAACDAAIEFGTSSTGSRLLSGNNFLFLELERQIAKDLGTESALIFNSGYQANISVIASLLDPMVLKEQALVFFDRANHASLYQGVWLSKAKMIRYRHNDLEHLLTLLKAYANTNSPKFIICETLHGMDGDLVNLPRLVTLAQEFNAFIYLDEAHATGMIGPDGYGLNTTVKFYNVPYIIMGTFSKGLGSQGAYIACSKAMKDYLINRCQGFIYSTALPPMVIAAAAKSWELVKNLNSERASLMGQAKKLKQRIKELNFDTGATNTHIIPVILRTTAVCLSANKLMQQQGMKVSVVRPPTVPVNTARLRINLTLRHNATALDQLHASFMELAMTCEQAPNI